MTIDISANNPRISYSVAAGVTQTSFAVPFEFFDDSDLNVYIDTTLQTITTNYTVTGGAGSTGTVTMTVTGPKTVIFTRDTTIERTTDFTAGVDINRAALNTQLDTLTAIAADNKDLGERSIRITDYDPAASNLLLPDAATRADKLLSFDTAGDVSVQAASDLLTGSVLGANYTKASYTGDGTIVAFSTTEAAGSKNNIQVYIDGVYQNKDTFSISGSTLTFSEAPPLNSAIEFIVGNAVTSLTTDPDVVTYNQGGTGAQDRTLTSKLQETVSVKDFGAVGNGSTNDYTAFNNAITAAQTTTTGVVYVPSTTSSYVLGTGLVLPAGVSLVGAAGKSPTLKFSNGVEVCILRESQQEMARIENLHIDTTNITNDFVAILYQGVWSCKIANVDLDGPGASDPSSGQVSYGIVYRSLYNTESPAGANYVASYTPHTSTTPLDALRDADHGFTYGVYFNSLETVRCEGYSYGFLAAGAEDGGAHRLNQNMYYVSRFNSNYYNIWMEGCGGGNTWVCVSAEGASDDAITIIDQSTGTNPVFISGEFSGSGDLLKGPLFAINAVGPTNPVANADGDSGTHLRIPESGANRFYGNLFQNLQLIEPELSGSSVSIAASTTYDITTLRSELSANAIYHCTVTQQGGGNANIAYVHAVGASGAIAVTSDVQFGSDLIFATDGTNKLQITNSNVSNARTVDFRIVQIQ